MRSGPARAVAAAALGVALAASPIGAAHAGDEAGSGLLSYRLAASAPGLALEGLYKDVALTVPETTSTLSTGGVGAGLSAVAWPGPVVGNAGNALLVLSGSLPQQVTLLNDPIRAESHSAGPQSATNTRIPGTVMASSANGTKVTASSRSGAPTTLPLGTVGALSGTSSTELTGPTSAVSTATTEVHDLTLADGVIKVGLLSSTSTTTTDGKKATATGSTTVSGVTIAGLPVTVDGTGVHLSGTALANPLTQGVLDAATRSLGLTIVVSAPRETTSGASARYEAGALAIVYSHGTTTYSLTLGRASSSVSVGLGLSEPATATMTPTPATHLPVHPTTSAPPAQAVAGSGTGLAVTTPGAVDTAPDATGTAPSPTVAEPAPAVTPQAAQAPLPGGAPAGMWVALLAAALAAGAVLLRLPRWLLAAGRRDECEESL